MIWELDSPKRTDRSETERPNRRREQPWRFGCPHGHSAWIYRANDDRYFCRTCEEPFDRLRDKKVEEVTLPPGGDGA